MPQTQLRPIDPQQPEPAVIAEAAAIVRRGGLVVFPTETVYGLGADATRASAVAGIFAAKGRPAINPLIVHVQDVAAAQQLVSSWNDRAARLAAAFWPGPLTLVLPKHARVPDVVTAGGMTVALRCPTHPVARALIAAAGCPIAAPSANLSNRLSSTRAEHVWRQLANRVDLILDGGPVPGGLESTVVDLVANPPCVLRPGAIQAEELAAVLGEPVTTNARSQAGEPLRSPGQLTRHYAPQTPLICLTLDSREQFALDLASGRRIAFVAWASAPTNVNPNCVVRRMPQEPRAYAAEIYAALHDLDDARFERIYVELPPDEPVWAAVRDRLLRAAVPL